jgi:SAM-dependent methyltransferase
MPRSARALRCWKLAAARASSPGKLAGRALNLTAIDIGVAMVAAARRNIVDPAARLQVASFEDLADTGPFDLIVSATAFHWVDPGVGLAKAARLLRPGGWRRC